MRREPHPGPLGREAPAGGVSQERCRPSRAYEGKTSRDRGGVRWVHVDVLVNRFDCRKPASGSGSARASGRGRSARSVERRAGPKRAALFDERSGGSGPGSRAGHPQGRTALRRRRRKPPEAGKRQSASEAAPLASRTVENPVQGGASSRSSLRGARYRAARDPRHGEGCERG